MQVGKVAAALLSRLPRGCCDKLASFLEQWLASEDAELRRTAAQVAAILLQVGSCSDRHPSAPSLLAI